VIREVKRAGELQLEGRLLPIFKRSDARFGASSRSFITGTAPRLPSG
jgi:hypothetical protein